MKYALCLSLLWMASSLYAKSTEEFNKTLLNEVRKEIKKDDDSFKKPVQRGPASVGPNPNRVIVEPLDIDKNVRQIGPNKW